MNRNRKVTPNAKWITLTGWKAEHREIFFTNYKVLKMQLKEKVRMLYAVKIYLHNCCLERERENTTLKVFRWRRNTEALRVIPRPKID